MDLYTQLKCAKDNDITQILFEAFHKVFKNIHTNKLDEFMDRLLEANGVRGSLAEQVLLNIVHAEKAFRKIHSKNN